MLAQLLIQFAFRVTFGLAVAMAILPSGQVTSGFYRVHLWVLMGLNTLAGLVFYSQRNQLETGSAGNSGWVLTLAAALAVLTYAASVIWLYEGRRLGRLALGLTAILGAAAAGLATPGIATGVDNRALVWGDVISSGLLLGTILGAMFLGHWYLNTPTMQLAPLRRLVLFIAAALLLRAAVSGTGLALLVASAEALQAVFWIFVSFRWLTGIVAAAVFAAMTWYTLKIPNTQSATGILYAAVVVAFLGELMSQLLSVQASFPV